MKSIIIFFLPFASLLSLTFFFSPLLTFGYSLNELQIFGQILQARNGDLSSSFGELSSDGGGGIAKRDAFTKRHHKSILRKRDSDSSQSLSVPTNISSNGGGGGANTITNPDQIPANFTIDQAYFSPNVTEAYELVNKSLSIEKYMFEHKKEFISTCSIILKQSSQQFDNNQTFGWFHFKQNTKKDKVIDTLIVTVDVACYEVTNYDPTGLNPGQPINNFTEKVIESLYWFQSDGEKSAADLRLAFSSDNTTSSPSTTPTETQVTNTTTTVTTGKTLKNDKKKVDLGSASSTTTTTTTSDSFLTGVKKSDKKIGESMNGKD